VYVGLNCLKIFVYVLFQASPHPWSQVGVLSKQLDCFGHRNFFRPILPYYKEIRVFPKIRVLPSATLPQTLDLKIHNDRSIVEICHQLSSTNGCSERDKVDRRRSTKLTTLPNSDR